ncbi:SDR family oxidoreductase [Chloroflexus sp.]|uniref:SDR family NAD(P)-dependent oxidoreductase n=1 Tax=Chloroflexus sp. TaxID=1904827 RepID=UPI00257CF5C1|nr:SDR family oxidoreductase [Chloroflexus sp.]
MARTPSDLRDLKAVVTGGSRGIGRAIAEALARAGAQVIISSTNSTNLTEAERALQAAGLHVTGIRCDVANRSEVEALASAAVERMGRIDLWVNNAGISGPFEGWDGSISGSTTPASQGHSAMHWTYRPMPGNR